MKIATGLVMSVRDWRGYRAARVAGNKRQSGDSVSVESGRGRSSAGGSERNVIDRLGDVCARSQTEGQYREGRAKVYRRRERDRG